MGKSMVMAWWEWEGMTTLHFSFPTQSRLISPYRPHMEMRERPVWEKSGPI